MKWNEFRSLHKGKSQRFELYGLYKDGQYEIPTDATSKKKWRKPKRSR